MKGEGLRKNGLRGEAGFGVHLHGDMNRKVSEKVVLREGGA